MILPVDHNQVTWSKVFLDDLCELLRRQDWRKSDEGRVHAGQQCHHHCRQHHISGLNLRPRYQRKPEYGNMVLAAMMEALLACVHAAFVTFSPVLSSTQLAQGLEKHFRPVEL